MRTAITLGKTHKGEWEIVATPDDNFMEQRQNFRKLRAEKTHKQFALVQFQESDGHATTVRFITEKEKSEQDKSHAETLAAIKAEQERAEQENNPSAERKKHEAEFAAATQKAEAEEKKTAIPSRK